MTSCGVAGVGAVDVVEVVVPAVVVVVGVAGAVEVETWLAGNRTLPTAGVGYPRFTMLTASCTAIPGVGPAFSTAILVSARRGSTAAVSYTHLTLPTKRI